MAVLGIPLVYILLLLVGSSGYIDSGALFNCLGFSIRPGLLTIYTVIKPFGVNVVSTFKSLLIFAASGQCSMDGIKLQMAFCVLLISFWTFSSAQLVSEAKAQQTPAHSLLSTEEHIKSIIPDKLKDLERTRLIIMKDKHTVIAYYGSNKIALSLHDSAPTSFKEVENFNESYYTNSSSKSVVRFLKIRNGYKTVNEIRQSEGKTNIEFVLNDRFIVNITGLANQTPTRVWSYMELPKLKELYNYR